MKDKNIYQEMKAVKKAERVASAKLNKVELDMQNEIAEAIRPIKEKYGPIIEKLEKDVRKKWRNSYHITYEYHDYASFNTGDITKLYAALLTYIEGEKFIPHRKFEPDINEGSIIIKEDVALQYAGMNYAIVDELYKNGDLVMLDEGFSSRVDFYNYVGEPNYKFGNYNYLKEFTNRLIQYRIDSNIKSPWDVTENDLYIFICDFIKSHPELALKNKEKREKMLAGQSEEEIFNSQYKKII